MKLYEVLVFHWFVTKFELVSDMISFDQSIYITEPCLFNDMGTIFFSIWLCDGWEEFVTHLIFSELRPQFQNNSILTLPPESCPRDFGSQKLRDLGIEQPLGRLEGSRPSETQCCARLEPRQTPRSPGLRPTAQSRQILSASGRSWKLRGGVIKIWKIHRCLWKLPAN